MSDHVHDCPGCGGYFECDLSGDDCTPETLCLQCQLEVAEAERDLYWQWLDAAMPACPEDEDCVCPRCQLEELRLLREGAK